MPKLTPVCTSELTRLSIKPDPDLLLLATPYEYGGDPSYTFTIPASVAFIEPWLNDAHFAQYSTPAGFRVNKGMDPRPPLAFGIVAIDLDYGNHKEDRPTEEDFDNLVRTWLVIDHTPNIVYPTRGGARAVYVLDPVITDPEDFEERRKAFVEKQTPLYEAATGRYRLDPTKDWTRLFRCPRVIRDDGTNLHTTPVRVFHCDPFDLTALKVRRKPKPKPPTGDQRFKDRDSYIDKLLAEFHVGNRNESLFKMITWVIKKYDADGRGRWLDRLHEIALGAGLTETEFCTVMKSALKYGGVK